MQAESGRAVSGGAVSYASGETGEVYGPYAMNADGLYGFRPASGGRLPRGKSPHRKTQLGETNNGRSALKLDRPLASFSAPAHARNQRCDGARGIDDMGARQETLANGLLTTELLTADDGRLTADDMQIQDGGVSLEALGGTYVLRAGGKATRRGWAFCRSRSRSRSSRNETIALRRRRRGWCYSVDEDGNACRAAYDVTVRPVKSYAVTTDETGARSDAAEPWRKQATIATQSARRRAMTARRRRRALPLQAKPGNHLVHARTGSVRVSVRKLDANGNAAEAAFRRAGADLQRAKRRAERERHRHFAANRRRRRVSVHFAHRAANTPARTPKGTRGGVAGPPAGALYYAERAADRCDADVHGCARRRERDADGRDARTGADGNRCALKLLVLPMGADDRFGADGRRVLRGAAAAGTYVLRQTQMPRAHAFRQADRDRCWRRGSACAFRWRNTRCCPSRKRV